MKPVQAAPAMVLTVEKFDPTSSKHRKRILDVYKKNEDVFQYIAMAYFNSAGSYKAITFEPMKVTKILEKIIDPTTGTYYKDELFQVRMTDSTPGDNRGILFDVIPKGLPVPTSPLFGYFSLALFISIMEFFKKNSPGDRIISDIEFSWGKSIDVEGMLNTTVILRFNTDEGMKYYDYSSEDPEVLNLIESM